MLLAEPGCGRDQPHPISLGRPWPRVQLCSPLRPASVLASLKAEEHHSSPARQRLPLSVLAAWRPHLGREQRPQTLSLSLCHSRLPTRVRGVGSVEERAGCGPPQR